MTFDEYVLSRYSYVDGQVVGPAHIVRGTPLGTGYLGTTILFEGKKRRVLMHRLVFLLVHKYLPETVDHVNGNREDNRPENLRAANRREQQGNRASKGYTVRTKRYLKPRYEVNCDHRYVGVFDSPEEASAAYQIARKKAFGDFAKK